MNANRDTEADGTLRRKPLGRVIAVGDRLAWVHGNTIHRSRVVCACPLCGGPVIELPVELRVEQPDETTHVCLPTHGGCNQGFAKTINVVLIEVG